MSDTLTQFRALLAAVWRLRWAALAAAWVFALAGWAAVATMPNTYESRARMYVDSETVLRPLLSGLAIGTDLSSEAITMSRIMLSRPSLERVARETDLHLRATTPQQFDALVASLATRINIATSQLDRNMYTISFTDVDPKMAQRVVQTMLNAFVEDTLGIKRTDANDARQFLEGQIKEYEQRLRSAEERLANFKQRNVGLMPGEVGGYYERLQAAMQRLETTHAEYRTAQSRREELLRQLEGEEPSFGVAPGQTATETGTSVDAQIGQHKARLESLLVRFTEKHPEVAAERETIERLEAQRSAEVASRSRSGLQPSLAGVSALNINPVYQNMRISLSQTELQLVDLRNRVANESADVQKLRGLVSTAPEIEAELVRLNRDYEVNRTQHQALLRSLETARLSDEASTSKEQLNFRVIEPPVVAAKPAAPNRLLLNSAVLFLALGAGMGVAFLVAQFKPVFSTREQLQAALALPVLGSISFAPQPDEERALQRQPWLAAAAAALLIVAFGLVLVMTAVAPPAATAAG